MYKNNDIPEEYNNLAEFSDNYLVWVRESKLISGTSYNAYIQYLIPSTYLVFTNNYKIKNGDKYTFDANYINNGMYNYLDSYDVNFELTTLQVDNDTFNDFNNDRADYPLIFIAQFCTAIIIVWILNQLTKLVRKGGAFN